MLYHIHLKGFNSSIVLTNTVFYIYIYIYIYIIYIYIKQNLWNKIESKCVKHSSIFARYIMYFLEVILFLTTKTHRIMVKDLYCFVMQHQWKTRLKALGKAVNSDILLTSTIFDQKLSWISKNKNTQNGLKHKNTR